MTSTSYTGDRPAYGEDTVLPAQSAYTTNKAIMSINGVPVWNTILGGIGDKDGQARPDECVGTVLYDQASNAGRMVSTDGTNLAWASNTTSPACLEYDL